MVLLHSSVEVDREEPELSHSFHISFEHDASVYFLAAESAQDMAEWMLAIKSVGWVVSEGMGGWGLREWVGGACPGDIRT